ncbi:MAG: putative hydroxymethylpyrimidine transporter CytX [Firmicutes bacterium]|nr:putative hydroxymethylpyrimidine transporter CytX [Bacillota bacterium]
MNKIKNPSMFLLWAGAAISIAEIYTGGIIAPLGLAKGLTAILLGHLIGTLLLAFGGYVSFTGGKNAMEKVRDSFGSGGVKIVAALNVLQLLGWSAVMIIQAGRALNGLVPMFSGLGLIIVGTIVFFWFFFFNNFSKRINDVSVLLLIVLCGVLSMNFSGTNPILSRDSISFVLALEISISMPISWLPLIGDYAKNGESGKGVFLSSFFGYFLASSLMYILGLLIMLYTGMDVIEFLSTNSFKLAGILVILFSTVTTTFLDIYSAVVSSKQIFKVENENLMVLVYTAIATAIAYVFPIEGYQNFLLLIGSVFIPVYTIVFTDCLLKSGDEQSAFNAGGILLAACGTMLYYYLSYNGIGMPTMIVLLSVSTAYMVLIKAKEFGGVANEQ